MARVEIRDAFLIVFTVETFDLKEFKLLLLSFELHSNDCQYKIVKYVTLILKIF